MFFKKILLIQELFFTPNHRVSRYHSYLWHVYVKKIVLGQLSPRKISPNPILNPNSNPNRNSKRGKIVLRGQLFGCQRKQTLTKNHNNNIAFIETTLLRNPNLLNYLLKWYRDYKLLRPIIFEQRTWLLHSCEFHLVLSMSLFVFFIYCVLWPIQFIHFFILIYWNKLLLWAVFALFVSLSLLQFSFYFFICKCIYKFLIFYL